MPLVEVSRHALEQHSERWPNGNVGWEARRRSIMADVLEAMVSARTSMKEPAFTNHGSKMTRAERKEKLRRRRPRDRHVRFAWTEDRSRVYLIESRDGLIVVITAISAGDTPLSDG